MTITYINLSLLLVCLLYLISFFIKANKLKKVAEQSFETLDVYLKKRYELLVYVFEQMRYIFKNDEAFILKVRDLIKYEYSVLERYEKIELNEKIASMIKIIISEADNSEKLKDDEGYKRFKNKESDLDDVIEKTRKDYNHSIKDYNKYIRPFPRCLLAVLFRFNTELTYDNYYNRYKYSESKKV